MLDYHVTQRLRLRIRRVQWSLGGARPAAGAAQLATAALDYCENAALLRAFDALNDTTLIQRPTHWPAIAALCAWPKFVLVVAAGSYILVGAIVLMGLRQV